MALIKCSECGTQISDKASVCLKCGCPLDITKQAILDEQKKKNKKIIISIVIALAIIVAIVAVVTGIVLLVQYINSPKGALPSCFYMPFVESVIV